MKNGKLNIKATEKERENQIFQAAKVEARANFKKSEFLQTKAAHHRAAARGLQKHIDELKEAAQ